MIAYETMIDFCSPFKENNILIINGSRVMFRAFLHKFYFSCTFLIH